MRDTETCHFWAGRFDSQERFCEYFVETYDEDNDDASISPFAETQSETSYDHDFLEYGYSDDAASLEELVADYSYSDQWLNWFTDRIKSLGLDGVNSFVFISESEIESPQSIDLGDGCYLQYLGTTTYKV